jgi:hypothetical protein
VRPGDRDEKVALYFLSSWYCSKRSARSNRSQRGWLRWLICGMSWITVPTATSFYESLACFVSWLRMARSLSYFNLYRG